MIEEMTLWEWISFVAGVLAVIGMPAAAILAVFSIRNDFRVGTSHLYGRPLSSRAEQPLGFWLDVIIKAIFGALMMFAPVFVLYELSNEALS